jgi:hypothetical protein
MPLTDSLTILSLRDAQFLRCGSDTGSTWLTDRCGRPATTEFVVWSAWWVALSAFVLLAAIGIRKAVRAFGAAAVAMDWRVPESAQNMAMFGSGPARVGTHRAVRPKELMVGVDGHSRRRVEPVDRLLPAPDRTIVEYV